MPTTNLPRAGVLVLGSNSIHSLLPATLTAQVEALLDSHRLSDAATLAEAQLKRLQSRPRVDEDEVQPCYSHLHSLSSLTVAVVSEKKCSMFTSA